MVEIKTGNIGRENTIISEMMRDIKFDTLAGLSMRALRSLRLEYAASENGEGYHVMRGESTLGDLSHSGKMEWLVKLDKDQAGELLKLASQKIDPNIRAEQILNNAEKVLLEAVGKAPDGSIRIQEKADKQMADVVIVKPRGWGDAETANEVVKLLENNEISHQWLDGVPSFAWFEALGNMLENPKKMQDWQDSIGLPQDKKGLRTRLNSWLATLQETTQIDSANDWKEKWNQRTRTRVEVTQDLIRAIYRKSRVQPAYSAYDDNLKSEVDRLLAIHDINGTLAPADFQSLVTEAVTTAIEERKRGIKQTTLTLKQKINKEMRLKMSRALVRKQLAHIKVKPGEEAIPLIRLREAMMEIGRMLGPKLGRESQAVLEHVLLYPEIEDDQRNPQGSVRPREARQQLRLYLDAFKTDEEGLENTESIQTAVTEWLRGLGYIQLGENVGKNITMRQLMEFENPSQAGIPYEWSEELDTISSILGEKMKQGSLEEIPSVIMDTFREHKYLDKLKKSDEIIPDRVEIWKLWQKELRIVLLARALDAQRQLALLEGYISNLADGKIKSFNWNSTLAEKQLKSDLAVDIPRVARNLKKITDELGWRMPDNIEGYMHEIVKMARGSDAIGVSSLPYEDEIFTKKGLEWRKKLSY